MVKPLSRPLAQDIAQAAREMAALVSGKEALDTSRRSPAVADLIYRGLRHWGLAQVRATRLASRPPDPEILCVLAIAWAALAESLRAPHVVVDEAVAAAKQIGGEKTAGFVNALLRKTIADTNASTVDARSPIAKWNAPAWWIDAIRTDYGDGAHAVLDALATRAPLTVRLLSASSEAVEHFLQQLDAAGLTGTPVGPAPSQAVVISPPVAVEKIPGFAQGLVSVQDSAAQRAAPLFDELFDKRLADRHSSDEPFLILDACAAPGGKSIALAQRFAADIWAVDASASRLSRLKHDLKRVRPTLKGRVVPVAADLLDEQALKAAGVPDCFDAILLDAPCSASGITRRHPEIAWRRDPESIRVVAQLQRRLLDAVWRRLKPGGELAFVTCSVFSQEGEAQQQAFLDRTPGVQLMPSPGRLLPVSDINNGLDQDGFFFAKFKKSSDPNDSEIFSQPVVDHPDRIDIGIRAGASGR